MRRFRPAPAALIALTALAAACGGSVEEPAARVADDGEVSPLTREQIEEHAEAMTPAIAESLGIVDSTIRMEPPMPAESIRLIPPTLDTLQPTL